VLCVCDLLVVASVGCGRERGLRLDLYASEWSGWQIPTSIDPRWYATTIDPRGNVTSIDPRWYATTMDPRESVTSMDPRGDFTSMDPHGNAFRPISPPLLAIARAEQV
jgi:hypothetical protein